MNNFIKKNWHTLSLGILITVVLTSHALYVYKTYQYPQWDENVYLQYAVNILSVFKHPTWHFWQDILLISQHRQPLYPFFISLPLLLFGTEHAYKIALLVNGAFYGVTILFTYFLSRQFLGKLPSVLASYMFAFYGFPLFYIHHVHQETAVTAFTVIALYFLVKACKSPSFKNTFLFSFFATIGTLTRWIVPVFLLGPFLVVVFTIVKTNLKLKRYNRLPFLYHILIFLLIGVISPVLLYFLPNFTLFMGYAEANRIGGPQWAPDAIKNSFSNASIIWYASVLAQQTIFFWLLFIAGFLVTAIHFKKFAFLLLAFVIPYLFLTFGSTWKDDRFIVPLYPVMAIISAVVIERLNTYLVKRMLIFFILLIGFLNFLGASWGVGPMKFSIHGDKSTVPHSIVLPMPIGHARRVWLAPISWPPRPDEGNVPIIWETIHKSFTDRRRNKPTILFAFDFPQINGPLATDATIEKPEAFMFTELYSSDDSYTLLFKKIYDADYILVKTGRVFDEPRRGQDVVRMIGLFDNALRINDNDLLPKAFKVIKTVHVPIDKSTVTIYKKIRMIENDEWLELAQMLSNSDPSSESEIFEVVRTIHPRK